MYGVVGTDSDYLTDLEVEFEEHDGTIYVEAAATAKELGCVFIKGPHKKSERSREKARLSYQGDFARLKDIRRASIVCVSVADMCKLLPVLCERLKVSIHANR